MEFLDMSLYKEKNFLHGKKFQVLSVKTDMCKNIIIFYYYLHCNKVSRSLALKVTFTRI